MIAQEVIDYFKKTYPGKNIVCLPEEGPTEIICEIDPSSEHPEKNVAIAAIKQSAPHYHKKAVEEYEVVKGTLKITVDDKVTTLQKGETCVIKPPSVHSASGDFSLVKVTSHPGWAPEDHFLV